MGEEGTRIAVMQSEGAPQVSYYHCEEGLASWETGTIIWEIRKGYFLSLK